MLRVPRQSNCELFDSMGMKIIPPIFSLMPVQNGGDGIFDGSSPIVMYTSLISASRCSDGARRLVPCVLAVVSTYAS